ncbi:MAG: sugar ABC transporter permease [Spirochaetales bacterium]|nr:sugar ABC transporter permease [Spirochaetales bacterium]
MKYNKLRSQRVAYRWMVIPSLVIYLFVMAFPIVLSLIISLSNFSGGKFFNGNPWHIVGVQQFVKLFQGSSFWHATRNNIYLVFISVFGQLPLGIFLAYIIYRKIVKFGPFWQGILYLPAIISVIVIGIMWNLIFSPYGPIAEVVNKEYYKNYNSKLVKVMESSFNEDGKLIITNQLVQNIIKINPKSVEEKYENPELGLIGVLESIKDEEKEMVLSDLSNLFSPVWSADFLSKDIVSMLPILFVTLWCWTGTYLILFLANMQKINSETIESAQIDGAKESAILIHIILPEISGTLVNAAVLCISGSFNSFAMIYAMTGGGPARLTQVLSIYMYEKAFVGVPNYPLANAISIMMVLFSLVLVFLTSICNKRLKGENNE